MTSRTIAVLGGTGGQGRGLAYRLALAGHEIIVGSRSAERAAAAAEEVRNRLDVPARVTGMSNDGACSSAELAILAVPYEGHSELVMQVGDNLAGKVVISCINPLGFDSEGPYALAVPDGSAAEEAQRIMPTARMVGAFHHVSAMNLWKGKDISHEDVLVCGDDADAKAMTIELARDVCGHAGIDAGPLRIARELEPLTAVLININKRYRVRSGVSITGVVPR